jgi:hypothetical protein
MTPSQKSPDMNAALDRLFGRSTAIVNDRCVPAPIGCGGTATTFRDALSRKEFGISGLCQACQDSVFGAPEEDAA